MTENKVKILRRLKIIQGQLEAIAKMIDNDEKCDQVFIQLKASHSAFKSMFELYAKCSFKNCLQQKEAFNEEEFEKIFKHLF